MRHRYLFSILLVNVLSLGQIAETWAQYDLEQLHDYSITVDDFDGTQARQLSTGGYNNVQVSSADIRGTGSPADYYVFDRAGDVHTVLSPDPGENGALLNRSDLTEDWPRARFFSLMRDYNRDGVPDLFVSSAESGREGIWVYTGERRGDRIVYSRADFGGVFGEVLAYSNAGSDQLLYTLRTDIPAIQDLDGDGDLDILAFDASGSYLWFYRNISAGAGSNPADYLRFELADRCYGGIYEDSFSAEIVLANAPGGCARPFDGGSDSTAAARGGLHPGSTVTPYDYDCDGDLDLLLGDVAASTIALLTNTPGPNGVAYYSAVDMSWSGGGNSAPEVLDFFPAAFVVEPLSGPTNGTCPQAVIVAPSNTGGGEDREAQHYYAPDGPGTLELQSRALFSGATFDHGTGSHFAFADLSGDGFPELLVGHESAYDASLAVPRQSTLRFYEATAERAYRETRPAWLAAINAALPADYLSLDPVFADLTGDGRADMLLGNAEGGISFADNRTVGDDINFGPLSLGWQGISVGIQSSPAVGDVNGDGLLDLIVGERAGNLNLFLNRGSATSPSFRAQPDDERYGMIDVRLPGFNSSALSRPTFMRLGGQNLLYVGSGQGRLLVYGDLPLTAGGTATLLAEIDTRAGNQLDPVFTGTTLGDTDRAVVWLGNQRGGYSAFATEMGSAAKATQDVQTATLYPNPNGGTFSVHGLRDRANYRFTIRDVLGRIVSEGMTAGQRIEVSGLKGVYVLAIESPDTTERFVAKLIVQ